MSDERILHARPDRRARASEPGSRTRTGGPGPGSTDPVPRTRFHGPGSTDPVPRVWGVGVDRPGGRTWSDRLVQVGGSGARGSERGLWRWCVGLWSFFGIRNVSEGLVMELDQPDARGLLVRFTGGRCRWPRASGLRRAGAARGVVARDLPGAAGGSACVDGVPGRRVELGRSGPGADRTGGADGWGPGARYRAQVVGHGFSRPGAWRGSRKSIDGAEDESVSPHSIWTSLRRVHRGRTPVRVRPTAEPPAGEATPQAPRPGSAALRSP